MTDEWVQFAACARVDPELFFPDAGGFADAAISICAECPVRLACLADALHRESQPGAESWGVYGGMSARQRECLVGRRSSLPCPDCGEPAPINYNKPTVCGLCRHRRRVNRRLERYASAVAA